MIQTGMITTICPPENKTEKFTLYQFIIETGGEYSKPVAIQVNEKLYKQVLGIGTGKHVSVAINLESRFAKGNWYNTIKGYQIT